MHAITYTHTHTHTLTLVTILTHIISYLYAYAFVDKSLMTFNIYLYIYTIFFTYYWVSFILGRDLRYCKNITRKAIKQLCFVQEEIPIILP